MKDQILSWLLTTLITLGGAGLLALIGFGIAALVTKAKGTKFENAMSAISLAIESASTRIRLELLPLLAKATALDSPGGRSITPEERDELLNKGVDIVKGSVAPSVLSVASGVLGGALDGLIKGRIEREVTYQQATLPASAPLLPALQLPKSTP